MASDHSDVEQVVFCCLDCQKPAIWEVDTTNLLLKREVITFFNQLRHTNDLFVKATDVKYLLQHHVEVSIIVSQSKVQSTNPHGCARQILSHHYPGVGWHNVLKVFFRVGDMTCCSCVQ